MCLVKQYLVLTVLSIVSNNWLVLGHVEMLQRENDSNFVLIMRLKKFEK